MRQGPSLVIAVHGGLIGPLVERLAALPTLPWLRSALEIVDIDAVADGA